MRLFDQHSHLRGWSGREVCELLSKKEFYYAAASLYPSVSEEEVGMMFEEACDVITRRTQRQCIEEGGWREIMLENGRVAYANINTKSVQWRKPFDASCFHDASGVDIETFTAIVLQQNLLIRGPYSSFVSMNPEDFWPHAETYLRQKMEAEVVS
jgi:hypothetical protein